jgi:hypothetical protein
VNSRNILICFIAQTCSYGHAQSTYVELSDSIVIKSLGRVVEEFRILPSTQGIFIIEFQKVSYNHVPQNGEIGSVQYDTYDPLGPRLLNAVYSIRFETSISTRVDPPPLVSSEYNGFPVLLYTGIEGMIKRKKAEQRKYWNKMGKYLPMGGVSAKFLIFEVVDSKLIAVHSSIPN